MFSQRVLTTRLMIIAALVLDPPLSAEVSSRECIRGNWLTPNMAWSIPGNTTVDISTMEFHIQSASDIVALAAIIHEDDHDGTPQVEDGRVRFQFRIDGSTAGAIAGPGEFYYRTPRDTTGTLHIRNFFQNISAGTHTLTLRAFNNNPSALTFGLVWLQPLMVDSAETTFADYRNPAPAINSSAFTTLASVTVPANVISRHLVLSTYVRGSSAGEVAFRYVAAGVVKEAMR